MGHAVGRPSFLLESGPTSLPRAPRGATDLEIHDAVLIAAAFCMYNRSVDGIDTWQPRDEALYLERGKKTASAKAASR